MLGVLGLDPNKESHQVAKVEEKTLSKEFPNERFHSVIPLLIHYQSFLVQCRNQKYILKPV